MRTVSGIFGSLLLLTCLAIPAAADGMRPLGGGSPFMSAPTPPRMQFHNPAMSHGRVMSGGVFRQQPFIIVNPGPVPPLTGTTVPPLSVGNAVNGTIAGFGNNLVIGKRRFVLGTLPDDHQRGHFRRFHRFHRFQRGFFPVVPFAFFDTQSPDQVVIVGDVAEYAGTDIETPAPETSAIPPAKPTWRSGKSVLTGTLDQPRVIVASPSSASEKSQKPASGSEPKRIPQIVEVPQ